MKRDIWALSLVFWEISFGFQRLPFPLFTERGQPLSERELIDGIVAAPIYSPDYRNDQGQVNDLLNFMTVNDYHRRPTIDQVHQRYMQLSGRRDNRSPARSPGIRRF